MIVTGRVKVNATTASLGQQVEPDDRVSLDDEAVTLSEHLTIAFHKPAGYVCSRRQQGSDPTIYELLPSHLHTLKPIGRLDKDSRGLLLLTTDGQLAQELTHPKHAKSKVYEVMLDRELEDTDLFQIKIGVELNDGVSRLEIESLEGNAKAYRITMQEGRNRQIRRTFSSLGYAVIDLFRTAFGTHKLDDLSEGSWRELKL